MNLRVAAAALNQTPLDWDNNYRNIQQAIRLARLLTDLMPDEPEALGLLALMVLHNARSTAALTPSATW